MKYYKYIVIFLSILILLLGGYIIYVQSTITPLDNNDIKEENNKDSINNINKELDYDCSFTQTFRFYQKIDYETYVDGTTYVLGDIYQSYEPILLIVYEEDADGNTTIKNHIESSVDTPFKIEKGLVLHAK